MLKPVQRFPQFLLILQDLLQATAFDHVDRENLEGAVTSLDKLTEQLDQRRERLEQSQLFHKLVKLSKTEWTDSETGRVIRSGPVIEVLESKDEESVVEMRDGVLILTDAGKLLLLLNSKKTPKTKEIDGCKIKWKIDVNQLCITDFSEDPFAKKLGDRADIQSNLDKIDQIEKLAGEMTIATTGLVNEITSHRENLAKSLSFLGTTTQMTLSLSNKLGFKKHIRFNSAIVAREWTDLIR